MHTLTITLTPARYAALQKTQELMLLAGGAAKTPEEYAQSVMDGACDSYAVQYPDDAPSAAEVAIYKDAAAQAEARATAEAEKAAAAQAKAAALEAEKAAAGESLADQIGAL